MILAELRELKLTMTMMIVNVNVYSASSQKITPLMRSMSCYKGSDKPGYKVGGSDAREQFEPYTFSEF